MDMRRRRGAHAAPGASREGAMSPALRASALALAACFALLLCCTLFVRALDMAGIPAPAPLNSSANPAKVEGRAVGQTLSVRGNLSVEGLLSGDLQEALSQKVGDMFPLRDAGLLAYGGLQRGVIGLANLACGYPVTPAYYGAAYAVDWGREAVVPIAAKVDEANLEGMRAMAAAVSAAQESHPHVRFVYDQLWDMYSSDKNPTYALQTGTYSKEVFDENLGGLLDGRVSVVWDPIASEEELDEEWLRTEHHWTLERALASYSRIGEVLGWEEVPYEGAVRVSDRWHGANARRALFLGFSDELWDLPTDFSGLTVRTAGGEEVLRGARGQLAAGEEPASWGGPYDGYDSWYGPADELVYENGAARNGRTCLVVGLSYEKPIDPYIARNYETTVCLDVVNVGKGKPLSDYIDEYRVDDVVIQLGLTSYESVMERSAGFLGLGE
ncbi:hypothetical protein [Adlercreutzia sp. ZJ305]|uniref:hypothetical protein n=2 Tax=unclassified Adlercreutzia TaxID=2636013 RepID=UPI0013ED4B5F|nr:hypothetical protein [Adlercreutzia sp. ZJ305]